MDKKEFEKLFRQRNRNREAIQIGMFEIAKRITPDEDWRQDIWMLLNRQIPKYNRTRGNPFGYYYKIATRYHWELYERRNKRAKREIPYTKIWGDTPPN